ncbi:hypothetical protein Naga_100067g5 [Nannochloropsis gaditana]|uniref:Uncharacterized protein n=1 Tax=Nannochloropsis gaditana TaxID=72520 RepID=W7TFV4_9STRA|nr:hypothetical protein Naga_100067g5 [Nannochloropsis gaditana]
MKHSPSTLLLFLCVATFSGPGSVEVGAFYLTPRVSTGADITSPVIVRAMRLQNFGTYRKSARVLSWVFPQFLRQIMFRGARHGSSTSRSSRSRSRTSGTNDAGPAPRTGRLAATALSYQVGPSFLQRMSAVSYNGVEGEGGRPSQQSVQQPQPQSAQQNVRPALNGEGGLAGAQENSDVIPILIKYTGGVGYKSLYTGVCRVLKERFGNIAIRKTILGVTEVRGGKKLGIFEVVIGDRSFTSKPGAVGVYLPMADLQAAIERVVVRREKENKMLAAAAAAVSAVASDGSDGISYQESIHP